MIQGLLSAPGRAVTAGLDGAAQSRPSPSRAQHLRLSPGPPPGPGVMPVPAGAAAHDGFHFNVTARPRLAGFGLDSYSMSASAVRGDCHAAVRFAARATP